MFPCKAGENGCCQGEVDTPAEVIQPEVKPPPVEDGPSDGSSEISELDIVVDRSLSPPSGLQRMTQMRHMELDAEFTRGIPLHRVLQRSKLWTAPSEVRRRHQAHELWQLSSQVTSFDVFLSHTWRTNGRWKILALTMQTGWLHGLVAWAVGVTFMLCLRAFDVIDDPWKTVSLTTISGMRNVTTSLSPWAIVCSQICLVIGLCLSPYMQLNTQTCFLDVACIHQEQNDMFERGLYGIGGCLSVAKELRVLYTPNYMSSLWCVFELTGFRKIAPQGNLAFLPIFIERASIVCALFMWCTPLALNFALAYANSGFRQANIVMFVAVSFLPSITFAVHTLRYNYREKLRLIDDLKNFDVDTLVCASDFDRTFILSAIESWYGSKSAFNDFVRSTLREELLGLLPSPHLPCRYAALILSGQLTWLLDFGLSMSKADGLLEYDLLCFGLATFSFTIFWFWFTINGVFYLSDRSASHGGTCLRDWFKTLAVVGVTCLWILTGFVLFLQVTRATYVWGLVCYVVFSMLLPCFILDAFKSCRRRVQP